MELSPATFDAFWDQTHKRLCQFICNRVSNEQDAEDLLQDIFLRIYVQSGSLRDPNRLESWMYQVARNRIIDHYRSQRQWVVLPETMISDEVSGFESSSAAEMDILLASLREGIETLPETYRDALIQADIRGMEQKDLAAKLGITLSGAKSRIQRARQKVKEAMLHCFDLEFDTRGQIMDYRRRCCC
jgi:RNA polymerase sigma-70 factor (ECF subfamily)